MSASLFDGDPGSTSDLAVVRALRELGLDACTEPSGAGENPPASLSEAKTVDRSRLPLPQMHPDIRREDRVKVFELVLRGLTAEAWQLAADLERHRTYRTRVTGRDTRESLALKRKLGLILRDGTPEQRADARRRLAELDRKMNPRRRRTHSTSTWPRKAA